MNKKIIFFDLDGTITDPMIGITNSVKYALKSFGIEISNNKDLYKFIGPPLQESFKEYYNFNVTETDLAIKKYREYFSDKGIFENSLYTNMDLLLKSLKDNNKTVILATSKPTIYAEKILKYFNIYKYFDFVSGSTLDGNISKKIDIIKYALSSNNITSLSDTIMIGDRKYDIVAAKELGIDSIGVLYGYGDYEELTNAEATYIAKNIMELSKLLNVPLY
ncbi:HAD family phosphatase [Clostridium bornimense]|uniref:HAD family phosphatase n=1 Tax=Clostridium bornimense TaxID=1216932 RepID=W6RU91_9CLOT|nr:HAD-IA family hydrolase [Clostridium bornimense]CDM67873.1 HAD family phosphatase [Clostridium bornimense]